MVNSLCYTCSVAGICEVVSLLHGKGVVAAVTNCPFCNGSKQRNVPQEPARQQRTVGEVLDIAERIKSLNQVKHEENVEAIECEICHHEVSIAKCDECGKQICGSCLIEEMGSSKVYCEDCYDNLAPAKL